MQESFLHFIWRSGRFDQRQLLTTCGQSLAILRRGVYQGHAGPDFTGAHLRIGDTLWHGQVEMHLYASEWYRHKHQDDPSYEATVLHVVWEEDKPVFRADGTRIPCLELKSRVDHQLMGRYQKLIHDGNGIPCKFSLAEIPELTKRTMFDRVLIERLERKAAEVLHTYAQNKGDWEETAWQHLAAGLGAPVNSEPMLQVARSLPLRLIQRYRAQPKQIDALIFGQAGMLSEDMEEKYPAELYREYAFLRQKHQLEPIPLSRWKYLRMRPIAFPTLRLARLAAVAARYENALANILVSDNHQEWLNSLDVLVHPYWTRHFRFGMPSKVQIKTLGKSAGAGIVINVMAPILYAYGMERNESRYQEKALQTLYKLPFEHNHKTARWKPLPVPQKDAADSQAILELQSRYCTPRRCLHCAIGCHLIASFRKGNPIIAEEPEMQDLIVMH